MSFLIAICVLVSLAQAQSPNSTSSNATDTAACPAPNIPGFFYQDNCRLICRKTHWTDIIVFYLGNYVAHTATVVTSPGQSLFTGVVAILTALLFPGGGIRNGVDAILSRAKWGKSNLETAARAGAICAVVRLEDSSDGDGNGEPKQEDGEGQGTTRLLPMATSTAESESVPNPPLEPNKELPSFRATRIHGYCSLPKGYVLMVVPRKSTFSDDGGNDNQSLPPATNSTSTTLSTSQGTTLSSSYNVVKILISLLQLIFSITTLYRTRGDQLTRYGYAAFGLTTVPYAWMSLVNLVGNAICPQYDTVYLVGSSGLDHLRQRSLENQNQNRDDHDSSTRQFNFGVTGEVGRLSPSSDASLVAAYHRAINMKKKGNDTIGWLIAFYVAAVPIIVVGSITRFKPGNSALYQRVWTTMWLVIGGSMAGTFPPPATFVERKPLVRGQVEKDEGETFASLFPLLLWAAPAVGGYVVVAQMLSEFGVCSLYRH